MGLGWAVSKLADALWRGVDSNLLSRETRSSWLLVSIECILYADKVRRTVLVGSNVVVAEQQ
jgi:hypothetical protein